MSALLFPRTTPLTNPLAPDPVNSLDKRAMSINDGDYVLNEAKYWDNGVWKNKVKLEKIQKHST